MFIDVHCHLTDENYAGENALSRVIERAREEGVLRFITSGYDLPSSKRCKQIAKTWDGVFFCAGFQPEELDGVGEEELSKLKELLRNEKCVAVGEIGLDYHFEDNPPREKQKAFFRAQIEMANEAGLPFVVHSRDACQDTLDVLEEAYAEGKLTHGFLMHCYSYSAECVQRFETLGGYFSFGGTATFKNAKKVKESVAKVRADRILSETDCPYLTPEPLRGRFPNEPKHITHTVKNLALLRGEDEEILKKRIWENAERLFFKMR